MGWGVLIANHLDQWLWCTNHKHWQAVRSYLLHPLVQVYNGAARFTSHSKLRDYAEPKPFFWAKPACFRFSSSNFNLVRGTSSLPSLVPASCASLGLPPLFFWSSVWWVLPIGFFYWISFYSFFILMCRSHILSTAGDALTESAFWQKPLSQQAIVGF
jgi:hypothetical protein